MAVGTRCVLGPVFAYIFINFWVKLWAGSGKYPGIRVGFICI